MKNLNILIGLAILAGIAYVSYTFGQNYDIQPKDTVMDEQTATPTTTQKPVVEEKPAVEEIPEYTGESFIRISSPTNGAMVTADSPFEVRGTVSPNTKTVHVTVFERGRYNSEGNFAMDVPVREKQIDSYTLKNFKLGDSSWSYTVNHGFDNVHFAAEGARYVARATFADGSFDEKQITISYAFEMAEMGKPVIYLYPEKTMPVAVNVAPTSGISISEPAINSGWNVIASPNGEIVNADGTVWPYLFWEGFASNFVTPEEGFVVANSEVDGFFTLKLTYLGMNDKEIADFKEFWVPRMQDKPYYFITFVDQQIFNTYAPLTVTPTPDTVIRVFFDYRGLDEKTAVPVQVLKPAPKRNGFTVIEWGGRLYR